MEDSIYSTLNRGLYKIAATDKPQVYEISPEQLTSGTMVAEVGQNIGNLFNKKRDFTNVETGYILGVDAGVPKFFIGTPTEYLNFDENGLTVVGGVSIDTIDIGGADATSFHVDVNGNMWLGAATFGAAVFSVTNAGAVTGSNFTITGGSITGTPIASIPNSTATDISLLEYTHNLTFSVTDADTIAWSSGTITLSNGRTFSISAGNTGNMSALTYIYLDPAVSSTVLQTTTTYSTAMGGNKKLIGTAQNNTVTASYIPYGPGQPLIDGANIGALSIIAGNIAASTITAAKMSVSQLSAITADMGAITAGSIVLPSGGFIRSGQTAYNTGTGWFIGNDGGIPKLSIGDSSDANKQLLWTGTDLVLNGYSLSVIVAGATADVNFGLFRGSYDDGLTSVVVNSTTTRNLLTTDAVFSTGSTGWRLYSGVFGNIADSTSLTWQNDYSYFVRLKSDAGDAWGGAVEGRSYFWGLTEFGFATLSMPLMQKTEGIYPDESLIGFMVGGDDNLYAVSGSGLVTTGATGLTSMDVTDLSAHNHLIFHNYRIDTHYAAFPSVSNSGFTRPTAHSGGNTDQANMYDANTATFGFAERSSGTADAIGLSWDGGTTYTPVVLNTINAANTVVTIGGQYETFGRTWSPSDFSNANFRLRIGDISSSSPYGSGFNESITFSTFGFSTGTWIHITGIEIELTSETEDEGDGGVDEHKIYDIRVKVYFTTSTNDGYAKFYIDDVLVATHRASIPRGTEQPVLMFAGGPNGANVASGRHIFYNNYRLKVVT